MSSLIEFRSTLAVGVGIGTPASFGIESRGFLAVLEAASTYSVSLQGSGAYTLTGTQVTPGGAVVIETSNVIMYQYTASGGETTVTFAGAIGGVCLSVTRGGMEVSDLFGAIGIISALLLPSYCCMSVLVRWL